MYDTQVPFAIIPTTVHIPVGSPPTLLYYHVLPSKPTAPIKMGKLHMGIWAGIAAGGVMVMLVLLPILGCMFSRSRKAKRAAELEEESAAEKGEVIYSTPAPAAVPAPTRPVNAILQKPAVSVGQHEVRSQTSTQSMSPSYQSQASTLSPQSPLRNSTPSPPHMQPMWTKPSP